MKEELFATIEVNPKWRIEHNETLLHRIYDIINDKAKEMHPLTEAEMLIQAIIEFEFYRYDDKR